jgi:hypothetical protein
MPSTVPYTLENMRQAADIVGGGGEGAGIFKRGMRRKKIYERKKN